MSPEYRITAVVDDATCEVCSERNGHIVNDVFDLAHDCESDNDCRCTFVQVGEYDLVSTIVRCPRCWQTRDTEVPRSWLRRGPDDAEHLVLCTDCALVTDAERDVLERRARTKHGRTDAIDSEPSYQSPTREHGPDETGSDSQPLLL